MRGHGVAPAPAALTQALGMGIAIPLSFFFVAAVHSIHGPGKVGLKAHALKANARHVLRGLEIVVPKAMHTHTARRARSEAARQADFDEFRHDVRANGCRGLGERD